MGSKMGLVKINGSRIDPRLAKEIVVLHRNDKRILVEGIGRDSAGRPLLKTNYWGKQLDTSNPDHYEPLPRDLRKSVESYVHSIYPRLRIEYAQR